MNVKEVQARFYVREDETLMVKISVHLLDGSEQSVETEVDTEVITVFVDVEGDRKQAVGQC